MMDVAAHNPTSRRSAAIILAAGKSTRMKTELPKVMHEVCGRPMLSYVLDACRDAGISTVCVVVGFGKDAIIGAYAGHPGVSFVEQKEQKGTGHAVQVCADIFEGFDGNMVVIAGDMPMIHAETLSALLSAHAETKATASLATTTLADPTGYGRIIRDTEGGFERIVEHRDCTDDQLGITEVNPSYYCFDALAMFDALAKITPNNAKGEYYITDTLEIIRNDGGTVTAKTSVPAEDAVGINSRADLAEITRLMRRRIQTGLMDEGVSIIDPETTWIDSQATIGPDTIIRPFSYIEGNAKIGSHCDVGPYAYVTAGAVVQDGSKVGPGALQAFDATACARAHVHTGSRSKGKQAVRRPPLPAGC